MELELFRIRLSYMSKDKELVESVNCFTLSGYFFTNLNNIDEQAEITLRNKWYNKQCALEVYKKFEVDRLPKDWSWFEWLIFHHFSGLVSPISNQPYVRSQIESFLDFEGK